MSRERRGSARGALQSIALCAFFMTGCSSPRHLEARTAQLDPVDPYLWLEDVTGARAQRWVQHQNSQTRATLEGDTRFAEFYETALEIATSPDRLPIGRIYDGYVYNLWQDGAHVRGVWRRATLSSYGSPEPVWEQLIDLDALSRSESKPLVFRDAVCLTGSGICMLGLSEAGGDALTWREFDVERRVFVPDGFQLPESRSSVAWLDRNRLLVATDWGSASMTASGYPFILKIWQRQTPLDRATEIHRGQSSDVALLVTVYPDEDGAPIPIAIEQETLFSSNYWRLDRSQPERIPVPPTATLWGVYDGYFIFSDRDPLQGAIAGSLFAISAGSSPSSVQTLFQPSARQTLDHVAISSDAILFTTSDNVRSRLIRIRRRDESWNSEGIAFPENGSLAVRASSPTSPEAFVVFEDFLTPSSLFQVTSASTLPRLIRTEPAQFDSRNLDVAQFEALSSDGTAIPYFVVRPRSPASPDRNPTMIYAYGGFGVSLTPSYWPEVGRLWLERGGTYVLANIRGGGEFGPAWHDAATGALRQRSFDDLYAVESDLVRRGITVPRRLGLMGISNGGLLVGVLLNQHPEMLHAAILQAPLLDMIRYDELFAGSSWVSEYGSFSRVQDRAHLLAYSPYHNLHPTSNFPTPLVITSTRDDRVHPSHARKYVARLQALGAHALFYESVAGGHFGATNPNESAYITAMQFTYLNQALMD